MNRPRFDSLFARLILAQAALLVLVIPLALVWLTAARADATTTPYAEIWAPLLARAAASPPDQELAQPIAGPPLQRSRSRPPARHLVTRHFKRAGYGPPDR